MLSLIKVLMLGHMSIIMQIPHFLTSISSLVTAYPPSMHIQVISSLHIKGCYQNKSLFSGVLGILKGMEIRRLLRLGVC